MIWSTVRLTKGVPHTKSGRTDGNWCLQADRCWSTHQKNGARLVGGSGRSKVIKEKKLEEKKRDDAKKRERKKKKDSAVAAAGPRPDCGVARKDHNTAVPGVVSEERDEGRIDSRYEEWAKILCGDDYDLIFRPEVRLAKGEGSDSIGAVPDELSRRGNSTWVSPSACSIPAKTV